MDQTITLAHGSGGEKYRELVKEVFLPAFGNRYLKPLTDSALLEGGHRIAMTTDSYVVKPLFFPGGDIGSLAVSGTVNDLAVSGAIPKYLSVGMIIEAGLETAVLKRITGSMAKTASEAGVFIVTGDTKVVESGSRDDGIFINTAGVGIFPEGRWIPKQKPEPGDNIIISGYAASHGMAIMSVRENMGFSPPILSDASPLADLAEAVINAGGSAIHAMRDPTRGGVAAVLCEWADTDIDITFNEKAVPVREDVNSACRLLGLDPMYIANEGIILFSVESGKAKQVLDALKKNKKGAEAAIIGEVTSGNGKVSAITEVGSKRSVIIPRGELLPRIC